MQIHNINRSRPIIIKPENLNRIYHLYRKKGFGVTEIPHLVNIYLDKCLAKEKSLKINKTSNRIKAKSS